MYLDSHPIHRDSDIANHKNEINCSDYRFVYMGGKGMFCFMMYLSSLFYMSSIVEFCGSTRKLPFYMIINSTLDYDLWAVGTWTPLHADVFRSYSWSANVCGRKQWLFLPPSQSHCIFDRYNLFLVFLIYTFKD